MPEGCINKPTDTSPKVTGKSPWDTYSEQGGQAGIKYIENPEASSPNLNLSPVISALIVVAGMTALSLG
jgi:hypothetical protein